MKYAIITLYLLFCSGIYSILCGQCIRIASWNIANFGDSKDASEISYIANIVSSNGIVAIQEVSVSEAGARAVAALADELNRKGAKWDYCVSEPTSGDGSERYAFIWNTSEAKIYRKGWLEDSLSDIINREPYMAFFICKSDTFLLANLHAVPASKNPASEISKLYKLDHLYEKYNLIILGDFNLPASRDAFNSLKKRGYLPVLTGQKTSLKMKINEKGEHLANEYDNILYESDVIVLDNSSVNDFSTEFGDIKEARKISDHIPVCGCFRIKQ